MYQGHLLTTIRQTTGLLYTSTYPGHQTIDMSGTQCLIQVKVCICQSYLVI